MFLAEGSGKATVKYQENVLSPEVSQMEGFSPKISQLEIRCWCIYLNSGHRDISPGPDLLFPV